MSILGHLTSEKKGIKEDTEEQWISFWLSGFTTEGVQQVLKGIAKEELGMFRLTVSRTPVEKMPGSLSVFTTNGIFLGWVPREIHRVVGHRFDRIEEGKILDIGPAWPGASALKPQVLFSYTNKPKVDHFRARALGVVK